METNTNLPYCIDLVIGDWSGDGHEKTRQYTIHSNLNKDCLVVAYWKAVEITGINLIKDVCSEYEDHNLPEDIYLKLCGFGVCELFREEDGSIDEDTLYMEPEFWVDLYCNFCKAGNPDFLFEFSTAPSSINIGGYGLFY